MQVAKKKEKWGKPKLVVLVRGVRQEGVLAYCKSGDYLMGAGPGSWRVRCLSLVGVSGPPCTACQTAGATWS